MNTRRLYFYLFGYAFLLVAGSFVLQFVFHLAPCPLCIIDRVLVILLTVLFAIALVHAPTAFGRYLYLGIGLVLTSLGILVTARHLWLMHLPAELAPDCGPGLSYLIETLPTKEIIMTILNGSGECTQNNATLLHLSLPAWTMIGFMVMAVGHVWSAYRMSRPNAS